MGGSESVKGAQYVPTTSLVNVQEYASSAKITDEMWVGFEENYGGWIETGQMAGSSAAASCCTLHPFIAHSKKSDLYGYEEYIWAGVNAEPTNLYTIEDAGANGRWCTIIWYTTQDCQQNATYYSTYSDNLEGGIEAAAENTKPENSGSQEVDAFTHSGTHIEWKGASKHAYKQLINYKGETLPAGVMCQGAGAHYGNDTWSTC